MRYGAPVLVIVIMLTSLSCSSTKIYSDHNSAVDFADYSSFAWFDRPDHKRPAGRRGQMSPLVEDRVEKAVNLELDSRGLTESTPRRADFLVATYTSLQRKVRVSHVGYGYGRWYGGLRGGTSYRHEYAVGSVVVDVIDPDRRELVWRGVAESAFSSPNPSDEKVAKVVARVLADFPPV
jgi:hypothetical protein